MIIASILYSAEGLLVEESIYFRGVSDIKELKAGLYDRAT